MSGLQEKFQVILPPQPNEDDGTEWQTFESARKSHNPGENLNVMPQADLKNPNQMLRQIAGCTDFSYDTTPESFATGYRRHAMNGADDQYTGEHVDHFYGEATDELGNTGFIERNNDLDRL